MIDQNVGHWVLYKKRGEPGGNSFVFSTKKIKLFLTRKRLTIFRSRDNFSRKLSKTQGSLNHSS